MSKLSFYTATFPSEFNQLADYFEKKSNKSNEFITISKKRSFYLELKYSHNQIIIEEYYDANNSKKTFERLSTKEIIFRLYNRKKNNFIILNQPRSILNLKNYLSKLFHFDFFLSKEVLDLSRLIDHLGGEIDHISKVEFREALYPNNIFSKHIFYTQNRDINLIESYTLLLKTNHYYIFKIDLFFKKYLGNKFTITNDYNFLFIGLSDDDIINFIFDNFPV